MREHKEYQSIIGGNPLKFNQKVILLETAKRINTLIPTTDPTYNSRLARERDYLKVSAVVNQFTHEIKHQSAMVVNTCRVPPKVKQRC